MEHGPNSNRRVHADVTNGCDMSQFTPCHHKDIAAYCKQTKALGTENFTYY